MSAYTPAGIEAALANPIGHILMGHHSTPSRRILIADDEPEVREMLKMVLELDQHSVREARDALEALELVTSESFDVVLTDYIMPGMKGDELAVEIKRRRPQLPVIMITGNADLLPDELDGVDHLLRKPLQIASLREIIRRVS
jgi:CheY-like chemotaxis protein